VDYKLNEVLCYFSLDFILNFKVIMCFQMSCNNNYNAMPHFFCVNLLLKIARRNLEAPIELLTFYSNISALY
jgi:hypothetical protein